MMSDELKNECFENFRAMAQLYSEQKSKILDNKTKEELNLFNEEIVEEIEEKIVSLKKKRQLAESKKAIKIPSSSNFPESSSKQYKYDIIVKKLL